MTAHRNIGRVGRQLVGVAAAAVLLPAIVTGTAGAAPVGQATTDTSPVNLSTKVDMAAGKAAPTATVVAGDARFEVLTPRVVRLEYSPTGTFLDDPTFTVLRRDFPVPAYTVTRSDGWLTIRTSAEVVRYQLGSGPFSAANTTVQVLNPAVGAPSTAASPAWLSECTFGQVCQAGAATLAGDAVLANNHLNYDSPAGFVAGYDKAGADATWQVLGAPAGPAQVGIRYANAVGALGGPAPRHMTLDVNGTPTQVTLPPTSSWDTWTTASFPVTLEAGTNTVAVDCATGDDCNVNVDDIAVSATGTAPVPVQPSDPLGGYLRSFDSANGTYSVGTPPCATGQSDTTCTAPIPTMQQGVLDRSGWYLLDDTTSDVWTADGWIAPRPAGDVEDGYLFGYGSDYAGALQDLAQLTGPTPLLPENAFGTWFSRYYPYTTSDYENTLLPEFKANGVSLDTLSVDTDWKAPNQWDGWEWNPALFPDPAAFLSWAKSQGIDVTLNVHSSISANDPQLGQAQALAGNNLTSSSCFSGPCFVWDWSNISQAESNFAVQQSVQNAGVPFWWLDWCCDASYVSMPGVTPDSWINHLYAQELANQGERGFVLSRIGASYQNSAAGAYATMAWADHRSAAHFTGDTWSTWNTLAMEAQLAQDEASVGQSYVSDDIGGFLGPPSGAANDPSDLYLRWLELGTFQPIMREHSNSGQNARLPWEYDNVTRLTGDQYLQLREQLVPYTYTLAQQASATGLPMSQPLYLDYPNETQAYNFPTEYLMGSNVLVAPVTTPGQVAAEQVWFPPGTWTDWFTGATFQGPSTQTLQVPVNRIPVFVKGGGIVPLQPATAHAADAGSSPLTLRVYPGGAGRFSLYQDAGSGLGYQQGQSATTTVATGPGDGANSSAPSCSSPSSPSSPSSHSSSASVGGVRAAAASPSGSANASSSSSPAGASSPSSTRAAASSVIIGPACGRYPGQPTSRQFTVDLMNLSRPAMVKVNGHPLPAADWSYDATAHTVSVQVPALGLSDSAVVSQVGGQPVQAAEPAATQLTISPSTSIVTTSGSTTTVQATLSNAGPGPVNSASVQMSAPAGWTVTATSPTTASTLAAGSSLTGTWSVTAPTTTSGQTATADLSASATYTDPTTGQPTTLTTQQLATPVITSVAPGTASAGQEVTVTGVDFGATQGSSFLKFSDQGTNWGAPGDLATFKIDSWSDTSITFTVPTPSGTNGVWHVVPGTTATITVTTANGQTSNTANVNIGS
jgi:hypothetical protein